MKDLKVIFMGTPNFAAPILDMLIKETNVVLVVTQPDKEVGRKRTVLMPPVKEEAEKYGIEVFQPKKIKIEMDKILSTECDIIITCAYGQILPKEILNYPRLKCVNVHASLLPKYRGGAPIHWCLINGEEKSGVTIMYMDEHMDTGNMISKEECVINDTDNVGTLHEKLSLIGRDLLYKTLPSIIDGTNESIKQDNDEASVAPNITREMEHLDFSLSGKEIVNKVRGLNPSPMANMLVNGEEYKVLEARFIKSDNTTTWKVMNVTKESFAIGCLDGYVEILKLKPFGKKVMDTKSFLNGVNKENVKNFIIS